MMRKKVIILVAVALLAPLNLRAQISQEVLSEIKRSLDLIEERLEILVREIKHLSFHIKAGHQETRLDTIQVSEDFERPSVTASSEESGAIEVTVDSLYFEDHPELHGHVYVGGLFFRNKTGGSFTVSDLESGIYTVEFRVADTSHKELIDKEGYILSRSVVKIE